MMLFSLRNLFLVLIVISILSINNKSEACTNFLVTKGASANGSNMITYAADAGGFMEPLKFFPAAEWADGEMIDIYDWDSEAYLGKIRQARKTYHVVGNINEHQLAIGETTFTGLEKYRDTTGLIDYGSLMYLVLQRAKTAREAIKLIDDLTKEYGYYSTGESFSIADTKEVWMMEVHPKGVGNKGLVWVAMRIPDGYIAAHANQSRIRNIKMNDPENCLYSKDVIEFAKKEGIYKEYKGEFSFADTYNPLDPGGVLFCEGRVWRFYSLAAPSLELSEDYFRAVEGADPYPLYIKPDNKIELKDLMTWMRDHFEGTDYDMTKGLAAGPHGCPYRWKGLLWNVDADTTRKFAWERPIGTQQTAFSFVAQLRDNMPNEIGGILWYGVDAASTSCYIPLYCSMGEVPKPYQGGSISEFSWESSFWVFNAVANRAYLMFNKIYPDIQKVQQNFEDKFLAFQPAIEKAALELHKNDPKQAVHFLTDYSVSQVNNVHTRWTELWKYITVKFNDGYINDVNVAGGRKPKSAGYDNEFLKQIIEERPGYYDVNWRQRAK